MFCECYVLDWNATQAAIEAGYSSDTARQQGSRLLSKVYIQEYIKHIQKDLQKLAGISKLKVLCELMNVIDSSEEATRDKLKALEVVNKMLGFNDPEKQEVKTIDNNIQDLTRLTDEELRKYLELANKSRPNQGGTSET